MKKILVLSSIVLSFTLLSACNKEEEFVIFTAMEEERLELLKEEIEKSDYKDKVRIELMSSGSVQREIAMNEETKADFVVALPYSMYGEIEENLAVLEVDTNKEDYADYIKDSVTDKMRPIAVYHSSIITNVSKNEIAVKSYNEVATGTTKFSMPDPNYSGTGSLIISGWDSIYNSNSKIGEFTSTNDFMVELNENIYDAGYTTSGSTPLKDVEAGNVNVGFGMHFLSDIAAEENNDIEVHIAEEGAPWAFEFNAMVDKDEVKEGSMEFFNWLVNANIKTDSEIMPTPLLQEQVDSLEDGTKEYEYYNINRLEGTIDKMGTVARRNEILDIFEKATS